MPASERQRQLGVTAKTLGVLGLLLLALPFNLALTAVALLRLGPSTETPRPSGPPGPGRSWSAGAR